MRIAGIESTNLFLGTSQQPLQVLRVTVVNEHPAVAEAIVYISGHGVRQHGPFRINGLTDGEERTVEIPVEVSAPCQPGSTRRVMVEIDGGERREADMTVAEPGWTMWMVSHFHYDPVWWNTQGQFTEGRLVLPDEEGRLPDVRTAFELVQVHLDKARNDPDYKFVLAELDYLKPYLDVFPQDRADLRQLMAEGRLEIVGGNYNEPNTNLTNAESTIRNAVYGIGYQRDVAGGDPRTAWMLDVFGHDPGYPGLMAAAGLTSSSWARGPFHQWGPAGADGGGVGRMQFASEFEWLSPDGAGLLTSYMAHHYGAGWRLHTPADLASAEHEAYQQFRDLARVAATRNVLLPVGSDHVIPARWVTDIHRSWNQRYVWPRFVTALPREYFDAVRAEVSGRGVWITPQTRDMNPVYTGKDVSCIDTKQAQRAIETAVAEAERAATLATVLTGARYPDESLDKTWRLLAYGAHHDAITGVESDQVYLDLVGSWREAWDRAHAVRHNAVRDLAARSLDAGAIVVFNGLARVRDGVARVQVRPPAGTTWTELRDPAGAAVPALATGVERDADGSLRSVTLTFTAREMPALGYREFTAHPVAASATTAEWEPAAGTTVSNEFFTVTADPAAGGTIDVTDLRTGTRVLRGPGNELVLQEEYAQHPKHGEGPWHLSPNGPGTGSASAPAVVQATRSPFGSRLVVSFRLGDLSVTQEIVLRDGCPRVEFATHVDGAIGRDRLLRVRFPADVPGGLPVYQTATAVIGRTFGAVDVDSAQDWYTLDNPALGWFGVGSTATVRLAPSGPAPASAQGAASDRRAIGVAEVICPDDHNEQWSVVRELMIALAGAGVTATCSQADGARYGGVDADSNLPDVRISLGGADLNAFNSAVLGSADPAYAKAVAQQLAVSGTARVWVPGARSRADAFAPSTDLRGPRDLPVLIVAGSGPAELAAAVRALIADLADAVIEAGPVAVADALAEPLADRSVAVLNRGTPGGVVTPDGTLHMSLMRSCSAWPSGIWIDGDRRAAPDDSAFSLQHWSHTFEYALTAGAGDWRSAGVNANEEDYAHDLVALAGDALTDGAVTDAAVTDAAVAGGAGAGDPLAGGAGAGGADAGAGASLLTVSPGSVTLCALKPRGNPLASGRPASAQDRGTTAGRSQGAALTVRLRETEGRPVSAAVRLAGGVSAAWLTDLLEETDGSPLPVEDGAVVVELPAFGTVTLVLRAARAGLPQAGPEPAGPDPASMEVVQPVYARYWLHGKGPAPAGNLPDAVHLSPARIALNEETRAESARLTVACGPAGATGAVVLLVPAELEVHLDGGPPRYELGAGQYAEWELTVRARPGVRAGRYFVGARITDAAGQHIEETVMVAVGEKRWPARDLDPEDAVERMLADYAAAAAEVDLVMETADVELRPGERGELIVTVTSHLASELRGEAQLVSPFGTWEVLGPSTQAVVVAPSDSTRLRFQVSVPPTARPGSHWWALVKLMYYGRVWYTQSVPIIVCPA
ncbi:MAG TPA: glycoside hydrolase family 38 C-terminal domain-containing protein [Streptosporangiaceae bacterium]